MDEKLKKKKKKKESAFQSQIKHFPINKMTSSKFGTESTWTINSKQKVRKVRVLFSFLNECPSRTNEKEAAFPTSVRRTCNQ